MKRTTRSPRDQDAHVIPNPDGAKWARWIVVRSGKRWCPSPTQRIAIKAGRAIAKRWSCDLVIHGRDGKIREKNSYGEDSPRRKG